jgi:hypothetical protein
VEQGLVFSSEIIQVHSDTNIDVKKEALTDLEAYCMKQKCRVRAFSPTITAGCDIRTYPFEVIIIYVSAMSITWHDIWQMLRRVRNPQRAVIWLAKTMPLNPLNIRHVSEAYTSHRLRAAELSHEALRRYGTTVDGIHEHANPTEIKQLLRKGDKPDIFKVIVSAMNMRDNSRREIEPQLRKLIKLTDGEIMEDIPDEYLKMIMGRLALEAWWHSTMRYATS